MCLWHLVSIGLEKGQFILNVWEFFMCLHAVCSQVKGMNIKSVIGWIS